MKRWKYILAFLIAPLGTPMTFALMSGLAFEPRSFNVVISAFPAFILSTAPVAYIVTLLFGIPAILLLSHKMRHTFPAILLIGTLTGTITGLFAGFYIGGYDIKGMFEYFSMDVISIYAPSTLSGMVCSIIFWVMIIIGIRENRNRIS